MEEQKLNDIIKKVRSIPQGRLVYSKKHKQSLPFLRVVTDGKHKGDVFFSGIKMPVSDVEDILPDALYSWEGWEASSLFKTREKVIDSDGKIIMHRVLFNKYSNNGNKKYISFAMSPYKYKNNIIFGEILFARIKGKGNYLIIPEPPSDDKMIISLYKAIDNAPALKEKSSKITIEFSDFEFIRPAVSRELDFFYGKVSNLGTNKKEVYTETKPKMIENTPAEELRPFKTKVLVANEVNDYWLPAIFGTYIDKPNGGRYAVVGGQTFKRCIIYKGENKKLLGKQVKMKSL